MLTRVEKLRIQIFPNVCFHLTFVLTPEVGLFVGLCSDETVWYEQYPADHSHITVTSGAV